MEEYIEDVLENNDSTLELLEALDSHNNLAAEEIVEFMANNDELVLN